MQTETKSTMTINMRTVAESDGFHPFVRELGVYLYINQYATVGSFFSAVTDETVSIIMKWIDALPGELEKHSGELYKSYPVWNFYTLVSMLAYAEGCTGKDFTGEMMMIAGEKMMLITILEYHARLAGETSDLVRKQYSLIE